MAPIMSAGISGVAGVHRRHRVWSRWHGVRRRGCPVERQVAVHERRWERGEGTVPERRGVRQPFGLPLGWPLLACVAPCVEFAGARGPRALLLLLLLASGSLPSPLGVGPLSGSGEFLAAVAGALATPPLAPCCRRPLRVVVPARTPCRRRVAGRARRECPRPRPAEPRGGGGAGCRHPLSTVDDL